MNLLIKFEKNSTETFIERSVCFFESHFHESRKHVEDNACPNYIWKLIRSDIKLTSPL